MFESFDEELKFAKAQGNLIGNSVQINQNVLSSVRTHLYLNNLVNKDPNKPVKEVTNNDR